MAEIVVTPTGRTLSTHGRIRKETGQFTYDTGENSVRTKLSRILFAQVTGIDDADNDHEWYWNSRSQAQNDGNNGWIHTYTGLQDANYMYVAYGE